MGRREATATNEATPDQLREAVENLHGCTATLLSVEQVTESFEGQTVWEGQIHVFSVSGHATASICYAWSIPVEGSENRRFYAVLAIPPVKSANDAIRATLLHESGFGRDC